MSLIYKEIVSPTKLGTLERDGDEGVVRIFISDLNKLSRRNGFVRLTSYNNNNEKLGSLVRVVRGVPQELRCNMKENSICVGYDDRVELGIKKIESDFYITVDSVNDYSGIFPFLWCHRSPTTRMEVRLSILLFVLGLIIGLVPGFLLSAF